MVVPRFPRSLPRQGKGQSGPTTKKCHLFVAQADCSFRCEVAVPNCAPGSLNFLPCIHKWPHRTLASAPGSTKNRTGEPPTDAATRGSRRPKRAEPWFLAPDRCTAPWWSESPCFPWFGTAWTFSPPVSLFLATGTGVPFQCRVPQSSHFLCWSESLLWVRAVGGSGELPGMRPS